MNHQEILSLAKKALHDEASAIYSLADRLDNRVIKAVELILSSRGRVIVSGMGKSGHVGRKISATLSSTGTPSFFLHPGEAFHGDLGMVTCDDVVMLLSNSGETDEIVRIIPFLRRVGAKIVSITGRIDSTLAKISDVALDACVSSEACPLNLAPTSSTTVAMAMGDALAIALLKTRGFREEDFANLHPSGSLGRRFYLVKDLMHVGDRLPTISPETPLKEAVIRMSKLGFGTLIIVGPKQELVGIFTDGDLRRYFQTSDVSLTISISKLLIRNPKTIGPERLAMEALKIMEQNSITSLVVAESEKVVGFLHLHDILKAKIV